MMNNEELVKQIRQASSDSDGFSVKLRVHLDFDNVKFRELVDLLNQYVEATRREPCIHRTVFECVYATESAIIGALEHMDKKHPEWQNLQSASAEINNILVSLIAPPSSE